MHLTLEEVLFEVFNISLVIFIVQSLVYSGLFCIYYHAVESLEAIDMIQVQIHHIPKTHKGH